MIDVKELSFRYQVRKMTAQDIDAVYELSVGNPLFFEYCPPYITRESIAADMAALPPGRSMDDKYYIGYLGDHKLIAVMDLICFYPDENTVWIGLFMMDQNHQGKGEGTAIIEECSAYLKHSGFAYIQLAFAKGNPQSEAFWKKNGFRKTGIESENEGYTAVVMQREL